MRAAQAAVTMVPVLWDQTRPAKPKLTRSALPDLNAGKKTTIPRYDYRNPAVFAADHLRSFVAGICRRGLCDDVAGFSRCQPGSGYADPSAGSVGRCARR